MVDTGILEDIILDKLTSALHGSGFDSDWKVRQLKNGNMVGTIEYHAMDEPGYYDGWFGINVTFDPRTFEIIRQTYSASRYHRRKYLWDTEYFGDSIHYAFQQIQKSLTNLIPDCGERIDWFAGRLTNWAEYLGQTVKTDDFNRIALTANPGDSPETVVAYFWEQNHEENPFPNIQAKRP